MRSLVQFCGELFQSFCTAVGITAIGAVLLFGLVFPPPKETPNTTNVKWKDESSVAARTMAGSVLYMSNWTVSDYWYFKIAKSGDNQMIGVAGQWSRL